MTHVSVTATSGDSVEDPNIPSIRIVGADDQQRGSTEATESSTTPSEGILLNLNKFIKKFSLSKKMRVDTDDNSENG